MTMDDVRRLRRQCQQPPRLGVEKILPPTVARPPPFRLRQGVSQSAEAPGAANSSGGPRIPGEQAGFDAPPEAKPSPRRAIVAQQEDVGLAAVLLTAGQPGTPAARRIRLEEIPGNF